MEKEVLTAEPREIKGKGAARTLRRAEIIPGVIYKGGKSLPITFVKKDLLKFIRQTFGEQVIVTIKLPKEEKLALMKEYQIEPVTHELLHVDFQEVAMDQALKIKVPVHPVGEAIGVKRDNGIMQIQMQEIEIEALAANIPSHLDVDVSELIVGSAIHVSDIASPEGVELISNPKDVVISILAPALAEEIEAEAEEAAEEAAEGEPEVTKKGKKDEETKEEES